MLRLSCPNCTVWCEASDIVLLEQVESLHRRSCSGRPRDESKSKSKKGTGNVDAAKVTKNRLPAGANKNIVYMEGSEAIQKLIQESLPSLVEDPVRRELMDTTLRQLMEGINNVISTEQGKNMFEIARQFAEQMNAELTSFDKFKTAVILLWKLICKLTSTPKIRYGMFLALLGTLVLILPPLIAEAAEVWISVVIMYLGRTIVTSGVYYLVNGVSDLLKQLEEEFGPQPWMSDML